MSLRARLALFIAAAVALALIAQALFGYFFFRKALAANFDRELKAVARRIASGPPLRPLRFPVRLERNGRLILQDPHFPDLPPSDVAGGRWVHTWRVYTEILPAGRVEVARDASEALGFLATLRGAAIVTAIFVAAFGALIAFVLSGPALRPLTHLLRVMDRVAESGDLNLRVPEEGEGELRELSRLFNRMLARVQGFLERERRFTQDASHELRTPLAAIKAQIEAHQHGYQDAETTLEAVAEEARRIERLVESLLVLAREGQTARMPFDLAALARKTARRFGAAYRGPDHLEVWGDPLLLGRALENLLDNAQKHAPGAAVEMRLQPTPESVVLEVADSGPGLTEEDRRLATEPFWRAPGASPEGVGLGLSVVAQVAKAHQGQLRLLANTPSGLRAQLLLPSQSRLGAETVDHS